MSIFNKQTILIDADIYRKYAGGGHDKQNIRYAYAVPANSVRSDEQLRKLGIRKMINYTGGKQEFIGTATCTTTDGKTHTVRFRYQPRHETMAVPAGYKTVSNTKTSSGNGDKFVRGVKAVGKAFDEFMGGGKKPTTSSGHKCASAKRKSTGTRKPATRKTATRNTTATKRKTATRKTTTKRKSTGTTRKKTRR